MRRFTWPITFMQLLRPVLGSESLLKMRATKEAQKSQNVR
jgi:hypothetical protein